MVKKRERESCRRGEIVVCQDEVKERWSGEKARYIVKASSSIGRIPAVTRISGIVPGHPRTNIGAGDLRSCSRWPMHIPGMTFEPIV